MAGAIEAITVNTCRGIRFLVLPAVLSVAPAAAADTPFIVWRAQGDGISAALGGLRGDARRGRALVIRQDKGNGIPRIPVGQR